MRRQSVIDPGGNRGHLIANSAVQTGIVWQETTFVKLDARTASRCQWRESIDSSSPAIILSRDLPEQV